MDFRVILFFEMQAGCVGIFPPMPSSDVPLERDGARQDEKDKKRRKDTLPGVIAFYRDSMQMPVVTSWDRGPEDRGCRLRSAGGFTDIRQKTENTPQGPALTTIEAEDVNACFAWLESRDDVEVLLGLTDTWYGDRIFQICDEEKNVVEVLAYRRNMKNRDTLPQEDPS